MSGILSLLVLLLLPTLQVRVHDEIKENRGLTALAIPENYEIEDRSIIENFSLLTKITGDFSRGDYIGASSNVLTLMESPRLHWTVRYFLRFLRRILTYIHPFYWSLFPSTKDRGSLIGNLQAGAENGASVAERISSIMGWL